MHVYRPRNRILPCRRMRFARPDASAYLRTRFPVLHRNGPACHRHWRSCVKVMFLGFGDLIGWAVPCLIEVVAGLEARGVGFRSLTEAIDTTTPGGRLIFHVFGALGQFERDLIRERTKAGLSAAAARGRKGGRKPVVTDEKLQKARMLLAQGLNVREAALRLKIGKTALYVALSTTQPAPKDSSAPTSENDTRAGPPGTHVS